MRVLVAAEPWYIMTIVGKLVIFLLFHSHAYATFSLLQITRTIMFIKAQHLTNNKINTDIRR